MIAKLSRIWAIRPSDLLSDFKTLVFDIKCLIAEQEQIEFEKGLASNNVAKQISIIGKKKK